MESSYINTLLELFNEHPSLISPVHFSLQDYLAKKGKTVYNLTSINEKLEYIVNVIKAYARKDPKMLETIAATINNIYKKK